MSLEELDTSDPSSQFPYFDLEGYVTEAKCLGIDQLGRIHLVFELHGTYYRWDCCFRGMITPSPKSVHAKERARAVQLRENLLNKLSDHVIRVRCGPLDMYRRCLNIEEMYTEYDDIVSWMYTQHYGYKKTSVKSRNWHDMHIRENISKLFV